MTKFYHFIFLTLLIISCGNPDKSEKKITKATSVNDILTFLTPDSETLDINPEKDNTINCKKGTILFFPANCFQFEDGTTPKNEIKLTVEEFYSTSDFISKGLSTTSNGNMLETSGMLNLIATSEGKKVNIRPDKSYIIKFPRKKTVGKMDLFYGQQINNSINWIPDMVSNYESGDPVEVDRSIIDTSFYECKIAVTGYLSLVGSSSGNIDNSYRIQWKMQHKDSTIFNYFKNNFKPSNTMLTAFCSDSINILMEVYLSKSGKINRIDFQEKNYYNDTIKNFLMGMPPFIMSSMRRENMNDSYDLLISSEVKINEEKYKKAFDKKYGQYKDKAIDKINKEDLDYFVFSATKLDWINCDRFLETEGEKIDFIVNAKVTKNSKVQLVFSDINSIIQGEIKGQTITFKNIPINRKVKLIGIDITNGKPTLAIDKITTSKESYQLGNFKECTLSELESNLNRQ